jgi:hypothetical protein
MYTYIYDVKISGFTRSSIYLYDISRLRVKADDTVLLTLTSHHSLNLAKRSCLPYTPET